MKVTFQNTMITLVLDDSRKWWKVTVVKNIIFRPEMKSTFHHTLITLAVVDILFVITLIIDTQVGVIWLLTIRFVFFYYCCSGLRMFIDTQNCILLWSRSRFWPMHIYSDQNQHNLLQVSPAFSHILQSWSTIRFDPERPYYSNLNLYLDYNSDQNPKLWS